MIKKISIGRWQASFYFITSSLTYRQRSVLCAGWVAALLPVGLRASVECQVMLTGLAGIVLSVWHSILCGNSILWRWWKRDGSKRLNHCIRSCCWLLVTLEQTEKEKIRLKKKKLTSYQRTKDFPLKQTFLNARKFVTEDKLQDLKFVWAITVCFSTLYSFSDY